MKSVIMCCHQILDMSFRNDINSIWGLLWGFFFFFWLVTFFFIFLAIGLLFTFDCCWWLLFRFCYFFLFSFLGFFCSFLVLFLLMVNLEKQNIHIFLFFLFFLENWLSFTFSWFFIENSFKNLRDLNLSLDYLWVPLMPWMKNPKEVHRRSLVPWQSGLSWIYCLGMPLLKFYKSDLSLYYLNQLLFRLKILELHLNLYQSLSNSKNIKIGVRHTCPSWSRKKSVISSFEKF